MQFETPINGAQWTVRTVRSITFKGEECDGKCDWKKQEIRIDRTLEGRKLAETLIHEVLHAACYILDENCIDQAARDIAEVLYHPAVRGHV